MRKSNLKECNEASIYSAQEQSNSHSNSQELTISSTILAKLASHLVAGYVVQEMRLYLI